MTKGVTYSRSLAAGAAFAFVAACALLWLRASAKGALTDQRRHAAAEEGDLATRIAALSGCQDEKVEALRRQVGLFRVHLGTEDTCERVVRRLAGGWAAEPGPRDDQDGYFIQKVTLSVLSRTVDAWPEIVGDLKDLEALPGVEVAEFNMTTSGNADRRTLDSARMLVVIRASRTTAHFTTTP